jgi:hypothetical protein
MAFLTNLPVPAPWDSRDGRSTTQDPWRRGEVIEQGEPMRWLWHRAPEALGHHPLGRQRRAWKLRICDKMVSKME